MITTLSSPVISQFSTYLVGYSSSPALFSLGTSILLSSHRCYNCVKTIAKVKASNIYYTSLMAGDNHLNTEKAKSSSELYIVTLVVRGKRVSPVRTVFIV